MPGSFSEFSMQCLFIKLKIWSVEMLLQFYRYPLAVDVGDIDQSLGERTTVKISGFCPFAVSQYSRVIDNTIKGKEREKIFLSTTTKMLEGLVSELLQRNFA